MKSFLSSLRQIDRTNRQASITRHWDSKLLITQTINNVSKSSTKQSSLILAWLLRSVGVIACTLGCQLFDVPKSLAAGVNVSGQVFSDTNSDGLNTGDSGIASVTVVLRNTTTSTCQIVSTNSSGNYSFSSVLAGNYEIIEAGDQINPTCTPAAGKTLAQTIGKDPTNYASTTPNVIPITVISSNVTAKNFGDHSATSLGTCPNPAYITQGTAGSNIKLNTVNLATGVLTPILNSDFLTNINGIGFNLVDGYIYGSQNANGNFNLLRTGLDGKLENLGDVLDVSGTTTHTNGSFIGDVDQNGIFYSIQGTTVTAIDVNPNSPTFKRYLKKFILSSNPGIQDIAISPIDSKVYTVSNSATSHLYRYSDFSIVTNGGTATIEDLGELKNVSGGGNMADGAKGAIYFAADGTLYAYRNGTSSGTDGAIYALSTTNISTIPKFTTITTTAPGVGLNDGARCMFAPAVALLNTYTVSGTLYKDSNNNGVNNSEPGLGANVTVSIYDDKNNNNIIDANEQITTTTSDANGLYTLSNLVAGTYKIKVDTIDVDIPSNHSLSTSNNLSVTVGTANITGKDFGFVTPQVVGFKSAKLTDSNADNKINPGETVTWTIDYVNTGSVDVTNFQITDVLPTGVTKSDAVTLSIGGTGQATPTVNSGYTGTNVTDTLFTAPITLKAGGMIKVTIPVTINSGISGILSNQSTATATNLPTVGIKTDNVDNTTSVPTGVTVPTGSVTQTQTATIDPTTVTVAIVAAVTPFKDRINSCGLITFDTNSEGFRAATITDSGTNYNTFSITPKSAPFTNSSGTFNWQSIGNPVGSIFTDDLDGQWTIFTTPDFGTDTNFSFLNNKSLTFDYRNDTGIAGAYDFWVALVGKNGNKVFYSFKTQLSGASTTAFSKVVVPMDATKWFTTFQTPTSTAPTSTIFTGILSNLDRIDIGAEGISGPDHTEIDNMGMACDHGDAPNTYGTLAATNGPSHQIISALKLGTKIDAENDGQPTSDAKGDDQDLSTSNRIGVIDDEDGITAFPALTVGGTNYSIPAANITAVNTTGVVATLHAWIDFNKNGTFEASEHTSTTINTSGAATGPLSWTTGFTIGSSGTTFARFRLTTDTSITASTLGGSATDGEVEDYQVSISNPADVLLLKRITAINGLSTNPNDNTTSLTGVLVDSKWKADYVVGATDGGPVKPGDTIEYTIYYLNNGGRNAKSARICDRLNAKQSFQPDTYTTGAGMQVQIGGNRITNTALNLTNQSGDDGGQFIAATSPVTALPINCNSVTGAPNNDYGALILDLVTSLGSPNLMTLPARTGQGTPNDSFGFWRFTTKVNKVSP